jgi:hypothetical protein
MSNYSDAHGATEAIRVTLRNNSKPLEALNAICAMATYDPHAGSWTGLREAGIELSQYVTGLVNSGQYSDLAGIDLAAVDWEAFVKDESDEG